MHPTAIFCEMILRVLTLSISREAIPAGGRSIAAPRTLVPPIGPQPRRRGLAGAGRQHLHGSVVGEDRLSGRHVPPDGIGQRLQKRRRLANPVRQRRAVQVQPVTLEDLALAIERQVIGVFID
jgi:hypothetical protein